MKTKELDNYIVYEDGRVWSKRRPRFLKPSQNNAGYLQLNINGKFVKVHRLVYQCFNGSIPDNMEVDHIDGNKLNNNAFNLQLLTHAQNIKKTYVQGRKPVTPHKGKRFSKETKSKMSIAKKGTKHPKFKGFYVVDGIKYNSATQAGKDIGVASITIIRRCNSDKFPNYLFELV